MIVELAVTAGPHAGRSFRFTEHATFIVGRSTHAHFSLPEKDPHVSRLHFLVEVNPPLCRVRNMSAVNGTLVNGAKVAQADLRNGDTITAGVTEFTVLLHTPPPDNAVPTVELPAARDPERPRTITDPRGAGTPDSFEEVLLALAGVAGSPAPPEEGLPPIPGYRGYRFSAAGGWGSCTRPSTWRAGRRSR